MYDSDLLFIDVASLIMVYNIPGLFDLEFEVFFLLEFFKLGGRFSEHFNLNIWEGIRKD